MSVLRAIESKLESLFEGVFGRAFRTNVQPVELARKLVKEMDDHRSVSVSRVYVPNEYPSSRSPEDREQFASIEVSLREELQDYLAEHARRERYVLLTPPRVKLESDADLDVGVFGIATRLVRGGKAAPEGAPPEQAAPGATMVYKPVATPPPDEDGADAAPEPAAEVRPAAALTIAGRRHALGGARPAPPAGVDDPLASAGFGAAAAAGGARARPARRAQEPDLRPWRSGGARLARAARRARRRQRPLGRGRRVRLVPSREVR